MKMLNVRNKEIVDGGTQSWWLEQPTAGLVFTYPQIEGNFIRELGVVRVRNSRPQLLLAFLFNITATNH